MMSKRWLFLVVSVFFGFTLLLGCSDVQSEYYEVHVIVVEETSFYYIDPTEGTSTLSAKYLSDGQSQFVYLYEAIEDVAFDYTQFFTTIESQWVEKDSRDSKLYVLASEEIDQQVNQFFLDREEWISTQP